MLPKIFTHQHFLSSVHFSFAASDAVSFPGNRAANWLVWLAKRMNPRRNGHVEATGPSPGRLDLYLAD